MASYSVLYSADKPCLSEDPLSQDAILFAVKFESTQNRRVPVS